MTAREVFRTGTYWLIIVAILFAAVPGNGLMTFLVAVLGERGFTAANAATYLSVFTIAGAIGTIVGGFILDRIDTVKVSVPFTLCSVVSFVILAQVSAAKGGVPLLYLAAALFGFSFGAHRPMGQFFHTRYFGLRSFTTVFAVQMALMALLFGFAAPVTGRIREATGSYDVVIWATVAGLCISALIYLMLGPYRFAKHIGAVPAQVQYREPAELAPTDLAHVVAAGRLLDLDHLGAEIGQVHAEQIRREQRELEHPHPGEQRIRHRSPSRGSSAPAVSQSSNASGLASVAESATRCGG